MTSRPVRCPICSSSVELVEKLSAEFIKQAHERHYNLPITDDLGFRDYDMFRCRKCGLEFAWPMAPGTAAFYEWITSKRCYYNDRWEWQVVADLIKKRPSSEPASLIEVGCGSGGALALFMGQSGVEAVGLDTTPSVVAQCLKKGLNVFCNDLSAFLASSQEKRFDYAVSFHCLEHVPDPLGLVKEMLSALKPDGTIFLSTPFSPMSFEGQMYDALNHPPHHMTRWNLAAYRQLASELGLSVQFRMPKASPWIDRVIYALNLAWFGPNNMVTNRRLAFTALIKPTSAIREILSQLTRERVNGKPAAEVVLVELKRLNP